jgi:hypothetical protein
MRGHRGNTLSCCNKVNAFATLFNYLKMITHDTCTNNLVI